MKKSFKYVAVLLTFIFVNPVFAAPAAVTIVKEQQIKDAVGEYLLKLGENPDIQVKIRHIGFSGNISIPAGDVQYEVVAPRQWEGWGKTTLALIVRVNDRVEKNISIPVEVEALTDMVVTVRPLERNEIVGATDVSLQKRDLATAPGKISRNLADVIGKKVRIGIRGNAPVRSDYLEKPTLVKSGQMVTIVAENDMLRITVMGRVKNSGAEGDFVTVQNLSSLKDVRARVVDAGMVRVEF